MKHLLTRAFLIFTLAALPLQASFADDASDEQRLRERAKGFWEAKTKRNFDAIFENYYVPESKGGPKEHATSELGAVQFGSYEILGVTIRGDRATVQTRNEIEFASKQLRPLSAAHRTMTIHQDWIRFEGDWYKEPVKPGLSAHEAFRARKDAYEAEQAAKKAAEAAKDTQ